MGRLVRVALGLILLLAAVRAMAYFVYAVVALVAPFETYHLEAKMVLLAYRVQAGESLYPLWRDYPHVANFFGPAYFVLVGLLGRVAGADIERLFLIGRAVTFVSALGTTLSVAWFLRCRYSRGAAWAGGLLSLGSLVMIGFSVMVRPDMMAETLGLTGFFLSGRRTKSGMVAGGLLLVLAILTKQTAAIFLLAAGLALFLEGRRRTALTLVGSCSAALLGLVAAISLGSSRTWPARSWGSRKHPGAFLPGVRPFGASGSAHPDLLFFSVLGLFLWSRGRFRDVRLCALTIIILATSVAASAKRGSDLNYYLSLRVIEALAFGTLWYAAGTVTSRSGRAAIILVATLGAVSLLPSAQFSVMQAVVNWRNADSMAGPPGRSFVRTYEQVIQTAEDPGVRLLTDAGLFDLHQRERAAYGDPWLFRLLVETGQIQPSKMQGWIDSEAYDLVVTTSDLFSPGYATYEFGLPMVPGRTPQTPLRLRRLRVGPFLLPSPRAGARADRSALRSG